MCLLPGFLLLSSFALLITELGECCSFLDKEIGGALDLKCGSGRCSPTLRVSFSESSSSTWQSTNIAIITVTDRSLLLPAPAALEIKARVSVPPVLGTRHSVRHQEGARLKIQ